MRVAYFPGAAGDTFALAYERALSELGPVDSMIVDLRGNVETRLPGKGLGPGRGGAQAVGAVWAIVDRSCGHGPCSFYPQLVPRPRTAFSSFENLLEDEVVAAGPLEEMAELQAGRTGADH